MQIFFHPKDQIFDNVKNDEIISIKLLPKKNNFTKNFFGIISLIMLYDVCANQNLNAPYMKKSNYSLLKYIKQYFYKFLLGTIV